MSSNIYLEIKDGNLAVILCERDSEGREWTNSEASIRLVDLFHAIEKAKEDDEKYWKEIAEIELESLTEKRKRKVR